MTHASSQNSGSKHPCSHIRSRCSPPFRPAHPARQLLQRSISRRECSAVLGGGSLAAHPPGEAGAGGRATASLAQRLPACLFGVAALALVQPAAFKWFHPAVNGQHALTCVMLATGLTLSLEVGAAQRLSMPACAGSPCMLYLLP